MCELTKERDEKKELYKNSTDKEERKLLMDDIRFLSRVINSSENKKTKWADMFEIGDKAEKNFENIARFYKCEYEKSDKATDMKKHIDCFITKEGTKERIGVDVKAIKKTSRTGNFDDSIQWIEFHNTFGGKGWLYSDAHIIAFQFEGGFYLVNRISLVDYCETLLEDAPIFHKKGRFDPIPFYHSYTRARSKDLIMKVKMKDVLKNCLVSKWEF